MRPLARAGAVIAAAVLAVPMYAAPAHAAAYRFWSYWDGNSGSWVYSSRGPSSGVHDGDIIGWRFAVSPDSSSAPRPRTTPSSLCANGVTVVIDYGVDSDAPSGETPPPGPRAFCADNDDSSTGYRATAEHASLRVRSDGLVCGIDGYPKSECAPIVTGPSSSKPTTKSSSPAAIGHVHSPHKRGDPPTSASSGTASGSTADPLPTTTITAAPGGSPMPNPTPTLIVSATAPDTNESKKGSGTPVALIVGIAIAAVLGGAAFWRYKSGSG